MKLLAGKKSLPQTPRNPLQASAAPSALFTLSLLRRAEPALTRIREDRTRIVLPAIDNIKFDTFEVQQYASAAHGYNWGLWCMYIVPPRDWLDRGDEAAPIRWTPRVGKGCVCGQRIGKARSVWALCPRAGVQERGNCSLQPICEHGSGGKGRKKEETEGRTDKWTGPAHRAVRVREVK